MGASSVLANMVLFMTDLVSWLTWNEDGVIFILPESVLRKTHLRYRSVGLITIILLADNVVDVLET